MGGAIGVAHHEGIEGIPRVQSVDAGGGGVFAYVKIPALVGQNEHHVYDLGIGLFGAHAYGVLVIFGDGGLGGVVGTLEDQDAILNGHRLQNLDPPIEAERGHLSPNIFTGQGPNAFDLFHSIFSLSILKLIYNSREKPKKQSFFQGTAEKNTLEQYIWRGCFFTHNI